MAEGRRAQLPVLFELNGLLARGIDWYEELTARLRGAAPRNRTHRLTLRRKNRTMVTVLVAPFK